MTKPAAALHYVDSVQELEERWPEIWGLLDAFGRFHADLHQKQLRPDLEKRTFDRFRAGLEKGGLWLAVAELNGQLVGVGSSTIVASGRTHAGSVGVLRDLYLHESVRGQGLYPRLEEMRIEPLRRRGVALIEDATSALNDRTAQLWSNRFWGCALRKHLESQPLRPSAEPIRRVKDLDEDWAQVWRLLGPASDLSEAEARRRTEAKLERRGAIFLAGREPSGVIVGRISINPWLFTERVGIVSELRVAAGAGGELADALLQQLQHWMLAKQATEIETSPLRHGTYDDWLERGFEPYLYWIQEQL